jgi:anti-anti-sigma factor
MRIPREMVQVPSLTCAPIHGVPVVTLPAEIDVTTAEQLRVALLHAASQGQPIVVVDLAQTRSCDTAGLRVLVRAHRRAFAEGGELRLVIPAEGAVAQIVVLTGLHRLIPCFASLDQALATDMARKSGSGEPTIG